MTAAHTVTVLPYAGACRCDGARDTTGAQTTHYTDNPECKHNPDNATQEVP